MADRQIRWGVIGAASIATNQMIPAIKHARNSRLAGVASRNEDKAHQLARQLGLERPYTSYDTLLESDDIDAVYIPLPTAMHTEWVLKAIAAGKHVLCEKPVGMSTRDIDQIIEAQNSTNLVVGEAFMVVHHPQWDCVRNLLKEKVIGQLRYVEGCFSYFNRDPESHKNSPALGGGGLRDVGVYPLLCTRLATNAEPIRVKADLKWDAVFNVDHFAKCYLEFDEFDLDFYCSTQLSKRQNMIFHGDQGWIRVPVPFNPVEWGTGRVEVRLEKQDKRQIYDWPSENQYVLQVENFARSILSNLPFAMTLENSRTNQAIIDALFESDRSGHRVTPQ
jgi:predicted dehydrogenase